MHSMHHLVGVPDSSAIHPFSSQCQGNSINRHAGAVCYVLMSRQIACCGVCASATEDSGPEKNLPTNSIEDSSQICLIKEGKVDNDDLQVIWLCCIGLKCKVSCGM